MYFHCTPRLSKPMTVNFFGHLRAAVRSMTSRLMCRLPPLSFSFSSHPPSLPSPLSPFFPHLAEFAPL
jgi:hypothetical protein